MGFMANGSIPASTIANDGFWPTVDVQDFAASSRLDGSVSPERMRWALIQGILRINRELQGWQDDQRFHGHSTLTAVPGLQIGGHSAHHHLYLQAVYSEARALLTEHYRDFDTTKSAEQRARSLEPQIDAYRAEARQAISQLTGRPRTVSELI